MAFTHDMYRVFEVDVSATFKIIYRDEFHSEDIGKWHEPEIKTTRVVCRREDQAKEYALERYKYGASKDVHVVAVRSLALQGLIVEMIQQM